MTEKKDDFDAVRKVVEALDGFEAKDQQRILRWATEKLEISGDALHQGSSIPSVVTPVVQSEFEERNLKKDIRSFIESKNPPSDVQFAATVAYYYQFEAYQQERKAAINSEDLQEACRKAGRARLKNPNNTLNNALKQGLLDRGAEKGTFAINSIGENLVAMALPSGGHTKRNNGLKRSRKQKHSKKTKR